jgi:hypothetical protein
MGRRKRRGRLRDLPLEAWVRREEKLPARILCNPYVKATEIICRRGQHPSSRGALPTFASAILHHGPLDTAALFD